MVNTEASDLRQSRVQLLEGLGDPDPNQENRQCPSGAGCSVPWTVSFSTWRKRAGFFTATRNRVAVRPVCGLASTKLWSQASSTSTELSQERREESEEARKERLLSHLLACFEAKGANIEEIRGHLTTAKVAGWDWKGLYEEAVRVQIAIRPDQADSIPPLSDVAPLE